MGLLLVLNFSVKPLTKLVEIKVHQAINHESWGTFMALFSLAFMFSILTDLGINNHVTNSLAKASKIPEKLLSSASGFKVISIVIYPFFMALAGYFMGYNATELVYLYFISLTHGFVQLMTYFRAIFQGTQHYQYDAIGSILEKAILLILLSALLLIHIDLQSFVIARLLAVFLACVILLYLLIRKNIKIKPDFSPTQLKPVIAAGLPFAIMTALYSMHERIDMVMVERLYSPEEAGLYGASYHIIDFSMMFLWLILTSLFARFSYYDNKEAKQKLLNSGVVITGIPLLMVAGFAWFYPELPFLLLFKQSTPEQIVVIAKNFQILSISLAANGLFAILSTVLTSNGFVKGVNKFLVFGIGLNILLNFVFVPKYGAIAAAWTTVFTNILVFIAYIFMIYHSKIVLPPWTKWAKISLVFCLYIGSLYIGFHYVEWYINTAIATCVVLFSTWFFRLLTKEYLTDL